jgi:hypothetical protein
MNGRTKFLYASFSLHNIKPSRPLAGLHTTAKVIKPASARVCLEMKDTVKVNFNCRYFGNPAACLSVPFESENSNEHDDIIF